MFGQPHTFIPVKPAKELLFSCCKNLEQNRKKGAESLSAGAANEGEKWVLKSCKKAILKNHENTVFKEVFVLYHSYKKGVTSAI